MNPEEVYKRGAHLDEPTRDELEQRGIAGSVRVGGFRAEFITLEGKEFGIDLSSAAVWLGVQDRANDQDYVMFVQQADRTLPDGNLPWEVPSGRVDPDLDDNIYGTLVREAFEETGIRLESVMTQAIAFKRDEEEVLGTTMVPVDQGEIWIHSEEEIMQACMKGPVKGGLIGLSVISIEQFLSTGPEQLPHRGASALIFAPPPIVNRSEISKIALVPLDDVMSGSSNFIKQTSHTWAQYDGYRAFLLKIWSSM